MSDSAPQVTAVAAIDAQRAIVEALSVYRFRYSSEYDLQRGIVAALQHSGLEYEREAKIPSGRLDFLCSGIAVEVKTRGSLGDLTRQIHRYLQEPDVRGVLVVTTRSIHRDLPDEISGKPVRVYWASEL